MVNMDNWKARRLCDAKRILNRESQRLWEDIQAVDDPMAYFVPEENRAEARKRIEYVDRMLKKHQNMFNSRWPVDYLYGNLLRHLKAMQPNQMRMDGVLDNQEQEIKEIRILMNEVLKDPRQFFDEPHHVGCRHFFSSKPTSNHPDY